MGLLFLFVNQLLIGDIKRCIAFWTFALLVAPFYGIAETVDA